MMFTKQSEAGFQEAMPGVEYKTLAHGEKTLLAEFKLAAGTLIPNHSHKHEQTGFLISGKMQFEIAGEIHEAEAGDSWNIAGHVEHGVRVWDDCQVIEVFSPVREDYLHPDASLPHSYRNE